MTSNSESGVFKEVLIVLKDLKERMELASITIGFRGMGGTQANWRGQPVNCLACRCHSWSMWDAGARTEKKLRWFGQNSRMQVWQRGNGGRN